MREEECWRSKKQFKNDAVGLIKHTSVCVVHDFSVQTPESHTCGRTGETLRS